MLRMTASTSLLAITLALLGGCASESGAGSDAGSEAAEGSEDPLPPDPEDPCAPGGTASLQIGEGDLSYQCLGDGDTIELIHGPQGGVHTLIALQARNIDGSAELEGELRGYLDGVQRGGSYPYLNFRCRDGEGLEVWNLFLFWDAPPEELHMQNVHIEVEFTDAAGEVMSASKEAIIYDPTL
jgi:hypothetical protein